MVKHSLRSLLAHKLRLLLTVVAVTVGVAFVSGTFVLSDTMGKAFDQLYAGLTKGTDVTVRSVSHTDGVDFSGGRRPLDQAMVDRVAAVPGVALAEGGVSGYALVIDRHGDPVQPGGAPTLASSVAHDRRLAGDFSYRAGRAPSGPHEVALDALTARKAGYRLGDTVRVDFESGPASFTLAGIVGFGDTDSLAGATLAAFDLATAQQRLDKVGEVDQIDVVGDGSGSAAQLRDAIAQRLPDGTEALTGAQVADEGAAAVRDGMQVFTRILLVFAGVSLLVGSFVIWNTFNVLVAQRRREIALLRAVGATRRQVLGGIVLEALVVGLVSAALGLLGGVGLAVGIRELLAAIGIEVPTTAATVAPRTVVAALLVGVVVTLVAAVAPAAGATRVGPVEALREAQAVSTGLSRRRVLAGSLVLGLGVLGMLACLSVGDQPALTGVSTLVAFAGLVVCGPLLARGIARLADRGPRGGGWRLAARNIARTPQRAAATALALTIGLTVVSAVAVTAASTKASVADLVDAGNRADLILQPPGPGAGFSPEVADRVRHQAGVASVVEMRHTQAQVAGGSAAVAGLGTEGLTDVVDLGIRAGDLADFGAGTMLLGTDQAAKLGVGPGDDVAVTFPETGERHFRVAATFARDSVIGTGYVVALPDFAGNVTSRLDVAVLVHEAAGADRAAVEAELTRAMRADFPNVDVKNPAELTADAQAGIDQMLGLVTALLLLAVVVAILGIVNTLVLSVVERTRELGLMRAVGATRRQVRTVVRRESVLMSLLGALTGLALGTLAGVALSRALVEQGVSTVRVPVATLVVYLVVAAVVGVLAAVGPARRASRVDVLRAVTVD
nr:FtsX-like permease family protein [Nocardioides panaciterrulae]